MWVLALVRGKLVVEITQHTQRSLLDGLRRTATEKSRRGLLAGLLESSIHNQGNEFGMMLSAASPTAVQGFPQAPGGGAVPPQPAR